MDVTWMYIVDRPMLQYVTMVDPESMANSLKVHEST